MGPSDENLIALPNWEGGGAGRGAEMDWQILQKIILKGMRGNHG